MRARRKRFLGELLVPSRQRSWPIAPPCARTRKGPAGKGSRKVQVRSKLLLPCNQHHASLPHAARGAQHAQSHCRSRLPEAWTQRDLPCLQVYNITLVQWSAPGAAAGAATEVLTSATWVRPTRSTMTTKCCSREQITSWKSQASRRPSGFTVIVPSMPCARSSGIDWSRGGDSQRANPQTTLQKGKNLGQGRVPASPSDGMVQSIVYGVVLECTRVSRRPSLLPVADQTLNDDAAFIRQYTARHFPGCSSYTVVVVRNVVDDGC
ncbi:hypothetical protein VTO42DRAFT_1698 [Malbranchea cinnamomea]